jgi:hypothetical protein
MGSHSFLVIEILKFMAVNARVMVAWVKHVAKAMIEGGVKGSIVCTADFNLERWGAETRKFVKKCCFNFNLLKCYCFEIIEQSSFFLKSCLEPTSLTIKIVS